jgi:hypothetical protein
MNTATSNALRNLVAGRSPSSALMVVEEPLEGRQFVGAVDGGGGADDYAGVVTAESAVLNRVDHREDALSGVQFGTGQLADVDHRVSSRIINTSALQLGQVGAIGISLCSRCGDDSCAERHAWTTRPSARQQVAIARQHVGRRV